MDKENILYYQSNIKTSRNEDSVYAMKYANQQMLIDKLQQENKQLKEVIDKAREYNRELSKLYDVGSMERSNADTNLLILGDKETIKKLK